MSQDSTITYEEWSELLAAHFFRGEYAGTHVMFFVDEACLAALGEDEPDAAVDSLVHAVVSRLRRSAPRRLFSAVVHNTTLWKANGGVGAPPALPVLALAVLAATRMRRTADTAAHNYYAWLVELLHDAGVGAGEDEIINSYGEALPGLWRALQWWLDERHHGSLGLSTIVEHSQWRWMGYADSQTLFTSSDREKLSQLFGWIGLRPREEIDAPELLQLFRVWAARRDDLSLGISAMLEDDRYPVQLAALLHAQARAWEGVVRDDEGRKEALIALTLVPTPPAALAFAAPRPPGFPPVLEISLATGRPLTLTTDDVGFSEDEQQWYEGLDLKPSRSMLETGLRLVSGDHSLRFPPYHYHVLHKSRELGCWASETNLRPSEPAWLLVRERVLGEVNAFLDQYARPGWEAIKREGIAPPGWLLIRDVIVDSAPAGIGGALSRLVPRTTNRASLNGGLPLARGNDLYLTSGEPDVVLPPREPGDPIPTVLIDGESIHIAAAASAVRLADLDLDEGTHRVSIDGAQRVISTLHTHHLTTPRVETPVAQVLKIHGTPRPLSLGAQRDAAAGRDLLLVAGAAVTGDAHDRARRRPLILRVGGAIRHMLLGPQPGEIEAPPTPTAPPWMSEVGLSFRVFEHEASFDVAWVITESSFHGRRAHLITELEPSLQAPPTAAADAVEAWGKALRDCDPPEGELARELWARYLAIAQGLVAA